jgi:hypothetical protein
MQNLLNRVDEGFKAIIDAAGLNVTVFTGHDSDEQVRPSVVVHSSSAEEMPIGSGNFRVNVSIKIRSNADDNTTGEHETLLDGVLGVVMTGSIGTDISALGLGVFLWDPTVNRTASSEIEDDCWVSELRFDAYSCLTQLA